MILYNIGKYIYFEEEISVYSFNSIRFASVFPAMPGDIIACLEWIFISLSEREC